MKFEHWTTKNGDTFWHLRTENGDILCASDRLRELGDALQAIGNIRAGVAHAAVVQIEDPNPMRPKRKPAVRKVVKKLSSKKKTKASKVATKSQKKRKR